ncbi:type II secretion system protein GspD [Mesoterricola silvestris]|uniref:Pilus (MSHA type) biogenesis protein MshL n=1 Tax=Mesoterricola silvestris TaxID=2927979 RepID=A0AA48GXL0_9BACT|nr:hypothetical protein [Mesoterricola silvestris]BDU72208.1 pilus (MSHA type) biogenesis protein MshL [Mesoterricola silvestris]
MKPVLLLPLLLLPLGAAPPPERMTIAVNEADLKDVLRAATADTDLNLIFEPGLATGVQGMNLKAMTLQDLLDQVLPRLGLTAVREGRNLFIQRSDTGLRFYHLDQLAMQRTGSKAFQVNASGQVPQGGASPASQSAYTSTVQVGSASDPWADVESGLMLLVFGRTVERQAGAPPGAPGSRGYAADGKSLLIQPNSGLVAVNADPGTHRRVEAFLKETRARSQRQVLLEARIVEVTLGADSQLGVDWNGLLSSSGNAALSSFQTGSTANPNVAPGQGLLKLVAQRGRVQATLAALARDNRLTVLSAPRLATLNNQKAILRVVREEAYALPSSQITPGAAGGAAVAAAQLAPLIVPVGIVLDILPQVGDDGVISLSVNPSISEVAEVRTFSVPSPQPNAPPLAETRLPVVDRRDLDAVVRVASGETLVLAGIIRRKEGSDNRGVPWVRRIPLLGALFSKTEKTFTRTELAIFITPTLMEDTGQVQAARKAAEQGLIQGIAPVDAPAPLE